MSNPSSVPPGSKVDEGLICLCGIASFFRIAADSAFLKRELSLHDRKTTAEDLIRAARLVGLKARVIKDVTGQRLSRIPLPAILETKHGGFRVFIARNQAGLCRVVDPVTKVLREVSGADLVDEIVPNVVLVTRRFGGEGFNPKTFGFRWFLPSIWRYRRPIAHVLAASFFIQIFALITPLFFQVVIDKVLTHRAYSTLFVLVAGLALVGIFDVVLQYLRTYALAHSTNRIDVELGARLFQHLMRLPISYFETRPAGQTVARVRELENIRQFLTGRDAISEPEAEQIEGDAARGLRDTPQAAQRVQNLVFPLTLRPDRQTIRIDGTDVALGAGMIVTAEIRTGSRRILEYIFSPLVKVGSEAMKER